MKKTITLFKRGTKWYGKKIVDGKEYTVSTGKTTKAEASKIAEYKLLTKLGIAPKTVHDSVHDSVHDRVQIGQKPEQQPEVQKQDKSEPQVRLIEVTQYWTANALHVRSGTRHKVVKRLRPYLRAIGETYESPLTRVFTKEAFQKFYRVRLAGRENAARQTAIRTANSYIQDIKSLFSRHFRESYPFEIPACVKAWTELSKPKVTDNAQYTIKDKKEIFKTIIKRCEALKESNPAAYLAYYLQLHCGLRRGEAASAKWCWLTDDCLLLQCDDEFQTKSGKDREIPLSEEQVAHLRSFRKTLTVRNRVGTTTTVEPDEHIIPGGTESHRYRYAADDVAQIIRDAGWKGHKSCHELRKYFGANVATQLGLFAAQKYLGHAGPEITSKYYADLTEKKAVTIGILT